MSVGRREPAGLWGLGAETELMGGNYTERFHLGLRKSVYQSELANHGPPSVLTEAVSSLLPGVCEQRLEAPEAGKLVRGLLPSRLFRGCGQSLGLPVQLCPSLGPVEPLQALR